MASLIKSLNSQHTRLVIQVLLLLAVAFVFCYSLLQTDWIGTPAISFALIVLITGNIIRLVEKSNRDFAQFLDNVAHNDFSSSTGVSNHAFAGQSFIQAQKTLLSQYRKLRADRSAQTEYLQMVVDHIDAALLCFDQSGRVEFTNKAAEQLLKKRYISSLATIASIDTNLARSLEDIRPGENRVLKLMLGGELNQLILSATEFVLQEHHLKLVSLKNIKGALDEREIESWQKLIKVLTHEIMNSMTPIVSLSRYVDSIVSDKQALAEAQNPDTEQSRDLHKSLEAIMSRSQGLMNFVDKYRSLSNLPRPKFDDVRIRALCERIELLLAEDTRAQGIAFFTKVQPPDLVLSVDESLLEQVLINLLSNAIDAVSGQELKKISLNAWVNESGKTLIQVSDNGSGISKEVIDNIFTPFFTTKDAGSGIGLSLSRQLARLNRGTLSVTSIEGEGSRFTLSF